MDNEIQPTDSAVVIHGKTLVILGETLLRAATPEMMSTMSAGELLREVANALREKRGRGRALHFPNVAEVRRHHPELWVIGTTPEGVLLDAWGGAS